MERDLYLVKLGADYSMVLFNSGWFDFGLLWTESTVSTLECFYLGHYLVASTLDSNWQEN